MKLKRFKSKKGFAQALWGVLLAGVIFVALGITLSVGADVTQTIRDEFTAGTGAYNAANNATEGIVNLAKWQPTIGTVIAAGAIIMIIMTAFVAWIMKRGKGL